MPPIKGDAALVIGATTHTLGGPFRVELYRELGRRWVRESLGRDVVDRTVIPTAAYEIVARIPYDDEPSGLLDALRTAANTGATLSYLPSASDTGVAYGLLAMDVGDVIEVVPDRDFGRWQRRWEIIARFRGVGSDLTGLITGPAVLATEDGVDFGFEIGGSPDAWFVEDIDEDVGIDDAVSSGVRIRNAVDASLALEA